MNYVLPTTRLLLTVGAVALWLWLWAYVGEHTWGWGRVTFWVLLAIVALLVAINTRWVRFAPAGWARGVLLAVLAVTCVYLVVRQASVIRAGFEPPWAERLWDVSQGAYDFNEALFGRGENPYRVRAQYHPVDGSRGYSRDAEGREYLFGWRYYYGYPHFPMSALWFAPFRGIYRGYNDIRAGNLVFFLLSLALLNAIVAAAAPQPMLACLIATIAFLGVDFQVTETFQLGIVDQAFAFPLLAAILLAMKSYWRIAGLVAGLALASKHFPAIPVVLALMIYAHGAGRLRDLAVCAGASFAAVMVPFVAWDLEAFVSATVLHHVHEADRGDNTALFFFLPDAWKMPFRLLGIAVIGGVYVWGYAAMKHADVRVMLLMTAVVCLLINAFYPVMHLNHLESILVFAAGSLALGLTQGRESPVSAAGRGLGG